MKFTINIVVILTLLIAVPGTVVAIITLRPKSEAVSLATSSSPTSIAQPSSSESPKSSASSDPGSECFEQISPDFQAIPCGNPHIYQLVHDKGDDCSSATVVRFLGGRVGLDVLAEGVKAVRKGGHCFVESPTREAGSFADVLNSEREGPWRACLDAKRERDVPCSVPHTGEYVGWTSAGDADAAACRGAATAYLGAAYPLIEDRIAANYLQRVRQDPTAARCILRARGTGLAIPIILRNTPTTQFDLVEMP